ncbi:MAG: TorF family putative porin [Campylobacterota bacterium]|nr:TorF family putative porin [Campylobacterota bacterium]
MKFIKLSLAAAVIASSLAAEGISFSGDATVTSNALWRGTSLTNDMAAVQATLAVEHESGVYASIWGTSLSSGAEFDLAVGYATEISGIGIDAGFVAYTYTDNVNEDYVMDEWGELYLGASYAIDALSFSGTLYKGVLDLDEDSTIIEAGVDYDFGAAYVGAAYGLQLDSDYGDDYYSATVGMPFESIKGDLSLTYADTTADNSDSVFALTYTTSF